MHQNEVDLEKIISSIISDNEQLQPGATSFILNVINCIAEAALIKKDTGEYRYSSSMPVTDKNLVRRSANNLALMSKSWTPYKICIIDESKEKLSMQHKILRDQFRFMLRSNVSEDELEGLACDLADVIQTSWALNLKG